MPDPITAGIVGGSGLIGGVLSSNAQSKGIKSAAASEAAAAARADETQRYFYDTSRRDNMQFLEPAGRSLATLQSALYGGKFGYDTPGYEQLDANDLAGLNKANPSQYDPNQTWFRGPDGGIVNAIPQMQAQWQPQESEGFKYTKSRTLEDLGRQLRMMGRGSGTVAANSFGRTLGDLNAGNEATQRNELWNMVKTGQGAAGSITGLGQNTANALSTSAINLGQSQANAALAQGQNKGNLYSGIGNLPMQAVNMSYMGGKGGKLW
jgi:hypothetical protein